VECEEGVIKEEINGEKPNLWSEERKMSDDKESRRLTLCKVWRVRRVMTKEEKQGD